MNRKISFGLWISVFWGGIRQFLCNVFSWKNKTTFWRVIGAVIALCVLIITGIIVYEFASYHASHELWYADYDRAISPDLSFHDNGTNAGTSFIYDSRSKKKVMNDIDWIAMPEDGDSLMVVARNGKRGYINRYTARVVLPFKYDAAWSFTDGVAGVCEGDSVYFIDRTGRPIHGRKFARQPGYDGYVYHGQYAALPMNGKFGLLDRNGNWALAPEYEDIHIGSRDMWYAVDQGKWGVIGPDGKFALPMVFDGLYINPDNGITVFNPDHSKSRLDYDGTLLDEFVCDETYHMAYYIDELDKDGSQKQAVDPMLKYSVGNYYGLMTKAGIPVTPPLYSNIDAMAEGIYQCTIPSTGDCIIINSRGEKVIKNINR